MKPNRVWVVECKLKTKRRWLIYLVRFDYWQAIGRRDELIESEPKHDFRVTPYEPVKRGRKK